MTISRILGIGLYGDNGHQIQHLLAHHSRAKLIATAAFPPEKLPENLRATTLSHYVSLDELLSDPRVNLVSLCSPRRIDQAADTICALEAGKHVYAEKPCAMDDDALNSIIQTSRKTGCFFHEMAGTFLCQPYWAMRQVVQSGQLGDIVQVIAEKSYPYHSGRPQDEAIDGGLIMQCGVHAFRWIEHVAGMKITSVCATETSRGNPVGDGSLVMAATITMELEKGALASVCANYLNPAGSGIWGYESLRIVGTKGFVESTQGGKQTRLVIGDRDLDALDQSQILPDYFDLFLDSILDQKEMPLNLEEELRPTRWVIRAKRAAALK